MTLPERCVSAGALVQIYGATNGAPTHKVKPLLSSNRRPKFQMHKRSRNEHKSGHGSRWGSKARMNVQERTSSNLLKWTEVD
jgi:ribosomal protein L19E